MYLMRKNRVHKNKTSIVRKDIKVLLPAFVPTWEDPLSEFKRIMRTAPFPIMKNDFGVVRIPLA